MSGGKGKMSPQEQEFYRKLRKTVRVWAGGDKGKANEYLDLILAGPDLFVLVVRLSRDDRLPGADKALLAGAAAYFLNPLDLVPELVLGPAGLVDDVALAGLVLHDILERTDPALVSQHWEGSVDLLDLVRRILAVADGMVGGPAWRRLLAVARGLSDRQGAH
jgi:uncharacterized membrane protein YkvA (DUF1232 family)